MTTQSTTTQVSISQGAAAGALGALATGCAIAACCVFSACVAPKPSPTIQTHPWTAEFTPPKSLDTGKVHLEPLEPKHVELDYAAFMSSRETLQKTLHWGSWPAADFTIERNRKDLEGHYSDYLGRRGYTYTVLTPDRSKCVGCVYLYPPERGRPRGGSGAARFLGDRRGDPRWARRARLEERRRLVGKGLSRSRRSTSRSTKTIRAASRSRESWDCPETKEWSERPDDVVFVWRRVARRGPFVGVPFAGGRRSLVIGDCWYAGRESNPQPSAPKADALSS